MDLPIVNNVYHHDLVIDVASRSRSPRGTGSTCSVEFYVAQLPIGATEVRMNVGTDKNIEMDISSPNNPMVTTSSTIPAGTHKAVFLAFNNETVVGSSVFEVIA